MSNRPPSDFRPKPVPSLQSKALPWPPPRSNKTPDVTEIRRNSHVGYTPHKSRTDTATGAQKAQGQDSQTATNLGVIPVSLDALVRVIRQSILRAQKASMCLATDNPDERYNVNKLKWSTEICREGRRACHFSAQDSQSPRARAEIEQFCEEMLEIFSRLFSRLALVQQNLMAEPLTALMLFDLSTAILDLGKEGGRRERLSLACSPEIGGAFTSDDRTSYDSTIGAVSLVSISVRCRL
jgi:hypothetical protein